MAFWSSSSFSSSEWSDLHTLRQDIAPPLTGHWQQRKSVLSRHRKHILPATNCLSVGGKIRDKLSLPPTVLQNKFSLFSSRKIEKYQCARGTAGKVSAVPFRVMAVLTQKLATPPLRLLESQSRYCTCGLVERQIRESHAWAALGSRTALHTTPQIS